MGLVAQVFDEEKLQALPGDVAIGHTRYSTTGSTHWANAQPLVHHGARAHGRARPQRQPDEHERAARRARGGRDRARRHLRHRGDRRADRARPGAACGGGRARDGAGSRAPTRSSRSSRGRCVGFRDPHGIRPLALGRLGRATGWSPRRPARSTSIGAALRARRAARRARRDRRGRPARDAGAARRRRRRALHLRARLLRAARTRRLAGVRGARRARADGRAARRRGAGRGRPRHADPRLGHAGRGRLLARAPGSPSARG